MFCTRNKNVLHKEQEVKDGGAGKEGDGWVVAMPEPFILFFWLIFPFFLVEKASAMYESAYSSGCRRCMKQGLPVTDSPVI